MPACHVSRLNYRRLVDMNTYTRYVFLILTLLVSDHYLDQNENGDYSQRLQVSIHFILSCTYEPYTTSISNIVSTFRSSSESHHIDIIHPEQRANATFFILCRNSDLNGAMRSVMEIEARFNRKYRYPYVFLNDEPFTDEFKECVLYFV